MKLPLKDDDYKKYWPKWEKYRDILVAFGGNVSSSAAFDFDIARYFQYIIAEIRKCQDALKERLKSYPIDQATKYINDICQKDSDLTKEKIENVLTDLKKYKVIYEKRKFYDKFTIAIKNGSEQLSMNDFEFSAVERDKEFRNQIQEKIQDINLNLEDFKKWLSDESKKFIENRRKIKQESLDKHIEILNNQQIDFGEFKQTFENEIDKDFPSFETFEKALNDEFQRLIKEENERLSKLTTEFNTTIKKIVELDGKAGNKFKSESEKMWKQITTNNNGNNNGNNNLDSEFKTLEKLIVAPSN